MWKPSARTRRPVFRSLGAWMMTISLVAGLSVNWGCSDDDEMVDPDFPHTVPTGGSMEIDAEILTAPGGLARGGGCHGIAAFVVGWTNLNVAVRTAIPVAVFVAAASNPPEYLGDQTWRWTASGGAGGGAWSASLTGHIAASDRVEWSMALSGTVLQLEDFIWYDGFSNPGATLGEWRYYDPATPNERNQVVLCTWDASAFDDRHLSFENTKEGAPENGDVLTYAVEGDLAFLEFEDADDEQSARIDFLLTTGEGSATNNEGICCWGPRPDFDDVTCDEVGRSNGS